MRSKIVPGDPRIAVGYCRVSTDADTQANGLAVQRAAIAQWAARSEAELVGIFEDEVSGGATLSKRPQLMAAIAAARAHKAGFLVVQRIDRFSRDPATFLLAERELHQAGVRLACTDGAGSGDDPTSELMRGVLVHVAAFEKAMIRARIQASLDLKRSRGEKLGGQAPYGFRKAIKGPLLEPSPHEQTVISYMQQMFNQRISLRKIRERLIEEGIHNRCGSAFGVSDIHHILREKRITHGTMVAEINLYDVLASQWHCSPQNIELLGQWIDSGDIEVKIVNLCKVIPKDRLLLLKDLDFIGRLPGSHPSHSSEHHRLLAAATFYVESLGKTANCNGDSSCAYAGGWADVIATDGSLYIECGTLRPDKPILAAQYGQTLMVIPYSDGDIIGYVFEPMGNGSRQQAISHRPAMDTTPSTRRKNRKNRLFRRGRRPKREEPQCQ